MLHSPLYRLSWVRRGQTFSYLRFPRAFIIKEVTHNGSICMSREDTLPRDTAEGIYKQGIISLSHSLIVEKRFSTIICNSVYNDVTTVLVNTGYNDVTTVLQ